MERSATNVAAFGRRIVSSATRHGRNALLLLRHGAAEELWREVRSRISSSIEYVVLCRDLSIPFPTPDARLPLSVHRMRPDDGATLFDTSLPDITGADLRARLSRRRLFHQGIGVPYVAATEDGRPVHVEWLFLERDNEALAQYSSQFFPTLHSDEAILEGVFTLESARGQGVMAWAQAEIALAARSHGVRTVFTFVAADNAASLKGSERAGFTWCGRQCERWRYLRRTIERRPLSPAAAPFLIPERVG
jgi:RimJ/RimL family protein N-acetyltransferase